jgi:hypothetical protein
MTNVNVTEEARRLAGVSDPTWSPPPAPEDPTDPGDRTGLGNPEPRWSRPGTFDDIRIEKRLPTRVQNAIRSRFGIKKQVVRVSVSQLTSITRTDLKQTTFGWDRTDWPAWVTSAEGFEIGSRWRLTQAAHVVFPQHCLYPTLALGEDPTSSARYAVEAGTTLTLVKVTAPVRREPDHDVADYYTYVEGWATRTYRIETGTSASILVWFSADRRGDRFPFSSRIAHAALVPESTEEPSPEQRAIPGLADRP